MQNTGLYKDFLQEFFINLLHPLVFLRNQKFDNFNKVEQVTVQYGCNEPLLIVMLVRLYHLVRLLLVNSYYRSNRAQRVCLFTNSFADTFFALKCVMEENSAMVQMCILLMSVFVAGYSIRIVERPLAEFSDMDFNSI